MVYRKGAAGVDHQTTDDFSEHDLEDLQRLHDHLRTATYRPTAVRRAWISKPGSDEKRPPGIPVVTRNVSVELGVGRMTSLQSMGSATLVLPMLASLRPSWETQLNVSSPPLPLSTSARQTRRENWRYSHLRQCATFRTDLPTIRPSIVPRLLLLPVRPHDHDMQQLS